MALAPVLSRLEGRGHAQQQTLLEGPADILKAERRQEAGLLLRQDPKDAVRLGAVGGYLRHQPGRSDADRTVQSRLAADALVEAVRGEKLESTPYARSEYSR